MILIFNKIWYGVRHYQDTLTKNFDDNTVIDNVTVTSSNFSQSNEMIRIMIHLMTKNHGKLPITDISVIQTLHLTCSFEVIILPT